MAKKTPWYPGTTHPARVGVYERRIGRNTTTRQMWDGHTWRWLDDYGSPSSYQVGAGCIKWRGLTKEQA